MIDVGFNCMPGAWGPMRAKHCYFIITPSLSLVLVLLWWEYNIMGNKKSNERKGLVPYLTPSVINILAWQFWLGDLRRLVPKMVISSFDLQLADDSHMSEMWCRSCSDGGGELIKEKGFQVSLVRLTPAKARAAFSEPAPSVTSDLIRGTTLNSGCEVS